MGQNDLNYNIITQLDSDRRLKIEFVARKVRFSFIRKTTMIK